MKLRICLLICLAISACADPGSDKVGVKDTISRGHVAQSNPATDIDLPQIPQSIPEIRQVYNQTNQQLMAHQLDSVALKYNCNGERSGTVTYYSKNNELKAIKHQYNEYDHFSATDQYFVVGGKLYFVFFDRLTWSFAGNDITKDDITEQRIYVIDDQAIECLEKKYTVMSNATKKPISENIPNQKVACKSAQTMLKDFKTLINFREQKQQDCLLK